MPTKTTQFQAPRLLKPTHRKLRVFAFDPSLATELENFDVSEVLVRVDWDDALQPGPVGEYVEVVDVDPASDCAYAPVDLNLHGLLAQDGLAPSEGNPQFHQQMVYAVAMSTIQNFECALGRKIFWSDQRVRVAGAEHFLPTERLRIYPHALRENNAYYDSSKKALLFGYFPARPRELGDAMPGGLVFTCLSHDIIAHETTHAILDGVQPYFLELSNTDVLAFHEAFADIVALFQHFTYREILRRQIARARGDLTTETLLGQLAVQFGKATGERGALRDAIGGWDERTGCWRRRKPDPTAFQTTTEPHARGALLVAAVFDAFLAIYQHRTGDLLRIATGGTGVLPPGDLHPDLVGRLAEEAAKSARHLLLMCIRAIDYCPPVDITFGDYLRALVTADFDLVPDDDRKYRVAVVEAFRKWGIYPEDVRTLSVDSLRWDAPDETQLRPFLWGLYPVLQGSAWQELKTGVSTAGEAGSDPRRRLTRMELRDRMHQLSARMHQQIHRRVMHILADDTALPETLFGLNVLLGHEQDYKFQVATLRPVRRIRPDGRTQDDLLIQLVQRRPGFFDEAKQERENKRYASRTGKEPPPFKTCDFTFRGGTSFIVDLETYEVRYAVSKDMLSQRRLGRQRELLQGIAGTRERELYFGRAVDGQLLANLHANQDY